MIDKSLFIQIVEADKSLPLWLRENANAAESLEEHQFDESYLQFLDEQINLSPRGPEWAEALKRRRTALSAFCNKRLARANIRISNLTLTVEVHPESRSVIHWEQHTSTDKE
jgi:hypothetical protein